MEVYKKIVKFHIDRIHSLSWFKRENLSIYHILFISINFASNLSIYLVLFISIYLEKRKQTRVRDWHKRDVFVDSWKGQNAFACDCAPIVVGQAAGVLAHARWAEFSVYTSNLSASLFEWHLKFCQAECWVLRHNGVLRVFLNSWLPAQEINKRTPAVIKEYEKMPSFLRMDKRNLRSERGFVTFTDGVDNQYY